MCDSLRHALTHVAYAPMFAMSLCLSLALSQAEMLVQATWKSALLSEGQESRLIPGRSLRTGGLSSTHTACRARTGGLWL